MKFFYYDHHTFPLPDHHRFPQGKYNLLREALVRDRVIRPENMIPAREATREELLLAHAPHYIEEIENGTLPKKREREMGLPWSPELAKRVRHTVGATIEAGKIALEEGIAATGGGGTHHAQWDRPQGYCIYNDTVIAARVLQQARLVSEVLVIDCDVHQGNGTALITADDPSIFTFSIHCEKNFPVRKAQSDLDIGLANGVGDPLYLAALKKALATIEHRFEPELIIYLSGADAHEGDRLGKLRLTFEGLAQRDQVVLDYARQRKVPLLLTLAGGYGREIKNTVRIYQQTIKLAAFQKVDL